ncbi:hypothetical protein ACFL0W_05105 [Nanoarchaeota archaeon]
MRKNKNNKKLKTNKLNKLNKLMKVFGFQKNSKKGAFAGAYSDFLSFTIFAFLLILFFFLANFKTDKIQADYEEFEDYSTGEATALAFLRSEVSLDLDGNNIPEKYSMATIMTLWHQDFIKEPEVIRLTNQTFKSFFGKNNYYIEELGVVNPGEESIAFLDRAHKFSLGSQGYDLITKEADYTDFLKVRISLPETDMIIEFAYKEEIAALKRSMS